MEEKNEALEIMVAALVTLRKQHEDFVAHIKSLEEKRIVGGELRTNGEDIEAEVLGVEFQLVRRPISIDGHFSMSEYAFLTEYDGEERCLLVLYLTPDGSLYRDHALSRRFSDYNNQYLQTNVVHELATALMISAVFAPRTVR